MARTGQPWSHGIGPFITGLGRVLMRGEKHEDREREREREKRGKGRGGEGERDGTLKWQRMFLL